MPNKNDAEWENEKRKLGRELLLACCVETSPPVRIGFILSVHRRHPKLRPFAPAFFNVRTWDYPYEKGPVDKVLLRAIVANSMKLLARDNVEFDGIAGVPNAATAITRELAAEYHLTPTTIAKDPNNEHGPFRVIDDRRPPQGTRLLLVENVTTTAHSVLKAKRAACAAGYLVTDVISIVDWEGGARERLQNSRPPIELHTIFSANWLMRLYQRDGDMPASIVARVAEFAQLLRGVPD